MCSDASESFLLQPVYSLNSCTSSSADLRAIKMFLMGQRDIKGEKLGLEGRLPLPYPQVMSEG